MGKGIMEKVIDYLNKYIFGPGLCVSLFLCGIFLTVYLGFFFILKPKKMLSALKTPSSTEMSPLKSMLVALAGTLGVGNIAGVASAIAIGGSGAVFWMLISSFAAIPVKYGEIVLARRHRKKGSNGKYHGGAFYYIASLGSRFAPIIATAFAVLCLAASLSMGCTLQANTLALSVERAFGVSPITAGVILGMVTLFVASGGLERISFVTSKLIPLMSAAYIGMSLYIIIANAPLLGGIFGDILTSALDFRAAGGGIFGMLTSRAMSVGVTRGIVSNEAGCGTAPIAHCTSEAAKPAVQGVWGIVEVVIDTPIMCTLTALVVLIAERLGVSLRSDGMTIAIDSFGEFIPFSEYILALAVIVFAFCTIICWFFYGIESLRFINKKGRSWVKYAYLIAYAVCTFIGSVGASELLWGLADLVISVMTAVNIVVILICRRQIKAETEGYFGGGCTRA